EDFGQLLDGVREAIARGVQPTINAQGSSGSYFCRVFDHQSADIRTVGIFKPKDEEPYGKLNPKWTKWLHRNCFPCFFGRGCLIPNLGYVSEAAAFLLDRRLGLNIVPRTEVVYLASPSFYYTRKDRMQSLRHLEAGLPPKQGSFQEFVHGYMDANRFFAQCPWIDDDISNGKIAIADAVLPSGSTSPINQLQWTSELKQQFREEVEKLVVLDYLMRNTDRGMDNWMIKVLATARLHLHIAAIDNGLAFPWKHPDQWRSYPYGWLRLPRTLLDRPFSERTRKLLLPMLTSRDWWQRTVTELRQLFQQDEDFNERMFACQLSVLKGQAWNLVKCLREPAEGPLQLCERVAAVVIDENVQ
ncbi:phosphatidylinositol 3 and 4-kinase-domain-containing protein, partial [Thamnocephalis sphaerospora]